MDLSNASLAFLDPLQSVDLRYKNIKNDLRLQGSFSLALKRPTKVPEYSRAYQPGDPIQMIDWKAYGRSDQLIIQEKRGEASARVCVSLDLRTSMYWPELEQYSQKVHATKIAFAARVALHLAYIHIKMGDLVVLRLIREDQISWVDLRLVSGIHALFKHLQEQQFSSQAFPQGESLQNRSDKFDILYQITDLLQESLTEELDKNSKHKCLLHSLSSLEISLEWMRDQVCYFDESSIKKEYLGQYLSQSHYLQEKVIQWQKKHEKDYHRCGWEYLLISDATHIEQFHQFLGLQTVYKKEF